MTNALRDQNHITTLLLVSNTDGSTTIPLTINPVSKSIMVDDGVTGSSLSSVPAKRDSNHVPVVMGLSSEDGVTLVEIYADSATGALLIQSI